MSEFQYPTILVHGPSGGIQYFIEDLENGLIKIGISSNVSARYTTLKKAYSPHKLNLLGWRPCVDASEEESILHRLFRLDRIHHPSKADGYTEWFERTESLLRYIQKWTLPPEYTPNSNIYSYYRMLGVHHAYEEIGEGERFVKFLGFCDLCRTRCDQKGTVFTTSWICKNCGSTNHTIPTRFNGLGVS